MQALDDGLELLNGDAQLAGDLLDVLRLGGQELVERRVEEADGDRLALHRLVERLKVALLVRHDLGEGLLAVLGVLGDDHLTHRLDALALEEHVLGAAQADALCAEGEALLGVTRGVGVGPDLELAVFVGPGHEVAEVAPDGFGANTVGTAWP